MDRAAAALAATARAQLSAALATLPASPKRLFIDDDLYCRATSSSPLLNLFTSPDALRKAHAIAAVLPLSAAAASPPPPAETSTVFLLRPSTRAARHVAAALEATAAAAARSLVLVTPRRSRAVERVLTAAVATGTVRVAVLPLGFLPFDDGLVTLHWPRAFAQVVLEGNNSAILAAAAGLRALADVLDVDFDAVRTAGAAGAATADELLEITGRKVHGVPGHSRSPSGAAAAAAAAADDRSVRSSEDEAEAGSFGGDEMGDAASAARAVSFFGRDVTVARVLAGMHLEKGTGAAPAAGLSGGLGLGRRRRRPVTLVIIDRNVDVVTPLLTQWTYEGLLDEAVGLLRGNVMDVGVNEFLSEDAAGMLGADAPAAAASRAPSNRRVQKRLRADGDSIFGQLRDLNYWAAARLLGSVASNVQAYYDARPGRDTAEIGQVKDYVRGLKEVKSEHRSAAVHTAIAAEVSARTFEQAAFKRRFELEREMLEGSSASGRRIVLHDAISRSEPLSHVLRLLCLWSLTGGGVDADSFEFLRREVIAAYGLSQLSLLGSLERAGLLSRSARIPTPGNMPWSPFVKFGFGGGGNNDGDHSAGDSPERNSGGAGQKGTSSSPPSSASVVGYSWQFVRAAMHLMSEFEPEAASSGGVAGPYSGYVPLTVRLIEAGVSSKGWAKLPRIAAHTLLLPPGHTVRERSVAAGTMAPPDDLPGLSSSPALGGVTEDTDLGEIDALVLFVGGVLRAEASAVRAAGMKTGKRILIATTDVCGANQFVSMS